MIETNQYQEKSKWRFIFIAMFVLMVVTVSTPFASQTGAIILSTAKMQILKLFTRSLSATLLLTTVFLVSYRKNGVPFLLRYCPLILYGTWALASCTWSANPRETINQGGSFGILILLSFAISYRWDNHRDTEHVLKTVAYMLLTLSCTLILMRFLAPKYGALTREANGLMHSTAASATASLGFLIVLLSRLVWDWKWSTKLFWVNSVIQLGTVLLSGNRFSILITGLVGGLSVFFLLRRDRVATIALLFGIAGTTYLVADPSGKLVESGLKEVGVFVSQGQTNEQLRTLSGRTEMWAEILNSFEDAPWKGHGYFISSKTGQLLVWDIWGNWTAHNVWLQLLVTTGIIGAVIFGLHLLVLLSTMIQLSNRQTSGERKYLVFFIFIGLWYLLWGLLNSSIFGPTSPETVVFFVVTGLLLGQRNSSCPEESA